MASFGPLNFLKSSRSAQAAVALLAVAAVSGGSYAAFASPAVKAAAQSPAVVTVATVAPTTVTVAPTATTTSTTLPPRPTTLAASSEAGRLVLIDPNTGRTSKVLATYTNSSDGCVALSQVSLTPDASTVYFALHYAAKDSLGNETCPSSIYKIATAGGKAVQVVKDGDEPAVSPDGNKLAYVTNTNGGDYTTDPNLAHDALRVLNLASGTTTEIPNTGGCDCGGSDMSWAPDSAHLAYQQLNCGCGGQPFDEINVIDTTHPDRAFQTVNMPNSLANKAQWSYPSYRPDGSMFVIENPSNTYDDAKQTFVTQTKAPRMLIVNPADSSVEKVITTGYSDSYYQGTAVDVTGNHILYVRAGVLMVSDNLARPTQLATGLISASW